jgi:hypothetical protein
LIVSQNEPADPEAISFVKHFDDSYLCSSSRKLAVK